MAELPGPVPSGAENVLDLGSVFDIVDVLDVEVVGSQEGKCGIIILGGEH